MNITKPPINSFLLLFFISMLPFVTFAQVSPTLGVGLGELTMKKGTIDVEVLTEIIMEKQKELKKEALKRFLFDKFPTGNFATKFYIQNCLYTLMNEKNPQVIKKEIMELTTNYSISLGLGTAYKMDSSTHYLIDGELRFLMIDINEAILRLKENDTPYKGLDYKLMVDITSLSLSNSQQMRAKGFFKNPINYEQGPHYASLTNTTGEKNTEIIALKTKLKDDLTLLCTKITRQIDNYVKNYDVIKEFYSRYKTEKPESIKKALLNDYKQEILELYPTSSFTQVLSTIKNKVDFKKAFDDYNTHFTEYNAKKLQNENFDKLKTSLEALLNLLPDLNANKVKLEKSANTLKDQKFILPADSLINPLTISKRLPSDSNAMKDNPDLLNNISQYNYDMGVDIALNNKFSELKNTIMSLGFKYATAIEPDKLKELSYVQDRLTKIKELMAFYLDEDIKKAESNANGDLILILETKGFLQIYLKFLLDNLVNRTDLNLGLNLQNENSLKVTQEFSQSISIFYAQLQELANKNTVTIADVNNLEKNIIPQLLKYSFFAQNKEVQSTITNFRILSSLLKTKIVIDANKEGDLKYNENLNSILTFVSNLDKLDKAQTYQSVIDLIQENNENVAQCLEDDFKPIYTLFINGIKKYTLLNTSEQYIEVDVVSFLNDLQQYYNKENKSWFSLYFTLGISENFFPKSITLPGASEPISNVGFASEKIGVQFTFYSFRKDEKVGFKNLVKDRVYTNYKNPFVNKVYGILYGSGLLYSLANTTTNENFDFPHVGLGSGLRFYNALDFNFSFCLPFIEGQDFGKNSFFSIGLDIPLGEYLEKLGKK